MKQFWLVFFLVSAAYSQPDPKALIRESIQKYEHDWQTGMSWGYTQTDATRSDGTREVDVSEVFPLEGTPYERLVSKDGHALTPEEQLKENEKYQKALELRKSESPAEKQARMHKYESQRAFIPEIPEAYTLALLGEDTVNNRSCWVIQLMPRPDFEPETPHASMLKHIEGKLWIDKQDVQWAKAEAIVKNTISIGWILARIGPGAHINLEFTRVADGLWMPKQIDITGTAKVLLVHKKILNEQLTFSDYHPYAGGATPRQVTRGKKKREGTKAFK